MKRFAHYCLAALLAGLPLQAMAVTGFVSATVNLRAGPDIAYPSVMLVPAGATIQVQGCIDGWTWCDVAYGDVRGWIGGNYILHDYGDRPVVVAVYGARLGIPVVSFSIVGYWGSHYTDRPFYRERERWYRRPPPHHAPPPPPRHPPFPPPHRPAAAPAGRSGQGHPDRDRDNQRDRGHASGPPAGHPGSDHR